MTQLFNVDETGVLTIDAPIARENIADAYKGALGSDLNTDSGTPQGNLIDFDMSVASLMQDSLLDMANSFVPYYAKGDQLDRIAAVFGYTRKRNQPTVVVCSVIGTDGTVIPEGALVSDGTYQYSALNGGTIAAGGVNLQFVCTTDGAVDVQPQTITEIITTIPGWDSVINLFHGITGYDTETDNEFKKRMMANELSIRSIGPLGAIVDRIAQLDGVLSVKGKENASDQSLVVDSNFTMGPNSIYIGVLGGRNEDIAKVLYEAKTLGALTTTPNGLTTVVSYYDPVCENQFNYNITRAEVVSPYVQILYTKTESSPDDVESVIKSQFIAWANNTQLKIGETVSGTLLSEAFQGFRYATIDSIKVKWNTFESFSDYLTVPIYHIVTFQNNRINVVEAS